eukprot:scaffold382_cov380-Prasinococcus_capsulatus_cf.AAC.28
MMHIQLHARFTRTAMLLRTPSLERALGDLEGGSPEGGGALGARVLAVGEDGVASVSVDEQGDRPPGALQQRPHRPEALLGRLGAPRLLEREEAVEVGALDQHRHEHEDQNLQPPLAGERLGRRSLAPRRRTYHSLDEEVAHAEVDVLCGEALVPVVQSVEGDYGVDDEVEGGVEDRDSLIVHGQARQADVSYKVEDGARDSQDVARVRNPRRVVGRGVVFQSTCVPVEPGRESRTRAFIPPAATAAACSAKMRGARQINNHPQPRGRLKSTLASPSASARA